MCLIYFEGIRAKREVKLSTTKEIANSDPETELAPDPTSNESDMSNLLFGKARVSTVDQIRTKRIATNADATEKSELKKKSTVASDMFTGTNVKRSSKFRKGPNTKIPVTSAELLTATDSNAVSISATKKTKPSGSPKKVTLSKLQSSTIESIRSDNTEFTGRRIRTFLQML
jgi:hypothetical protein